jgi:hypothetical protein
MNIQEFQLYLSVVKDIFTVIASMIAGIVAIVGLQTWRKQLKGKTEYELAQKLLTAVYKIRDSIYYVRNPFMSAGEISQAMKDANIEGNPLDPKVNASSMQAVYQQRWSRVQEAWNNIDVILLEAEALWGKDITELAKQLSGCSADLRIHIQMYLRNLQNPKEVLPGKMEEIDNVVYGYTGDEDRNKFSAKLLESIHKFEEFLKPRLIS